MIFPPGVRTREVTCGGAFLPVSDAEARQVVTEVEITSTRYMIWDGSPIPVVNGIKHRSEPGQPVKFEALVSDMVGMVDAETMQPIDISPANTVTHQLIITISHRLGIRSLGGRIVTVPILTGEEPLDLDRLIVSGYVEGIPVAVPDLWSSLVQQALTAAQEAEAAAQLAASADTGALARANWELLQLLKRPISQGLPQNLPVSQLL